jgi:hypothetical protein
MGTHLCSYFLLAALLCTSSLLTDLLAALLYSIYLLTVLLCLCFYTIMIAHLCFSSP